MADFVVVTLLRHGLTDENIRRAYIGWLDSPLHSSGIETIHDLRKNITHELEKNELIFTSDLQRCKQTAAILFSTPAKELAGLREIHFGDWEGKTYDQLQADKAYRQWLHDFFTQKPPNGEHTKDFFQRVELAWTDIRQTVLASGAGHVAIVTHGGVIRYLLSEYGVPCRAFWKWHVPHGGGYQLVWSRDKFEEGCRCISLREVPLTENVNG